MNERLPDGIPDISIRPTVKLDVPWVVSHFEFNRRNLTCLIQEEETLGIAPVFWKDENEERAVLPMVQLR